jgi:hypothetical protein
MSGWGRIPDRGIFDKETRRKPLAIVADAVSVSLYMEFEWRFRRLFALRQVGDASLRGAGTLATCYYALKATCRGRKNPSRRAREASAAQRLRSSRLLVTDLEWAAADTVISSSRALAGRTTAVGS